MTINGERRRAGLPEYPAVEPYRPGSAEWDAFWTGMSSSVRLNLQEAIRRDEAQRRPKIEELVRAAVEMGWQYGAAGVPKPAVSMTWDDEGQAHVHVAYTIGPWECFPKD